MSVAGIRQGLKDNIQAGGFGFQVSRYRIASPTPPGIMIVRGEVRPHRAMMQGAVEYDFRVLAFVSMDDVASQTKLDPLLDTPGGLLEAVESDQTLGGNADSVKVVEIPEEQVLVGADNVQRVIAEWRVTVQVNGST